METTSVCSEAFWSVRSSRCPSNALWSRWSNSDSGIPPSSLLNTGKSSVSTAADSRTEGAAAMSCVFWIVVEMSEFSSCVATSLDFSSGSLSVSEVGTITSSRSDSSGSLPNAFQGEKWAKLKKKKLACYKGRVVGNLFKDSLVMMHKHSSFPHWGRPEVRDQRYVLLWSCVENFNCTSWKNKLFRRNIPLKHFME